MTVKQKNYCNVEIHDNIYYLIFYFKIYQSKYKNIMDLIMHD